MAPLKLFTGDLLIKWIKWQSVNAFTDFLDTNVAMFGKCNSSNFQGVSSYSKFESCNRQNKTSEPRRFGKFESGGEPMLKYS